MCRGTDVGQGSGEIFALILFFLLFLLVLTLDVLLN